MNVKKEFREDQQALYEIDDQIDAVQEAYDRARVELEYHEKGTQSDVDRLHQNIVHLWDEEKRIREGYAKHIYDFFSVQQPELVQEGTGKVVPWREAFGDSFAELDTEVKNTLVALLEEDGGQYRFKKS